MFPPPACDALLDDEGEGAKVAHDGDFGDVWEAVEDVGRDGRDARAPARVLDVLTDGGREPVVLLKAPGPQAPPVPAGPHEAVIIGHDPAEAGDLGGVGLSQSGGEFLQGRRGAEDSEHRLGLPDPAGIWPLHPRVTEAAQRGGPG